ncbi:MAG: type II secretion system GspH family protein [Candidatus Nomurabacteria bacterium]|jgi:type II secretory pathway pseudopilin PulG|nr:type II secretion system GspH family protein [Candidatus Nomurabacteria bacterium]
MKKQSGFTIIELLVAFVVLVTLAIFFAIQRGELETATRDQERKVAINAMYYNLTEVFYVKNKYYPDTISRDNLTAMDPGLFTDPSKVTLNGNECVYTDKEGKKATDGNCNYRYTPTECNENGECQRFKLTADMEAEATYIKISPENRAD